MQHGSELKPDRVIEHQWEKDSGLVFLVSFLGFSLQERLNGGTVMKDRVMVLNFCLDVFRHVTEKLCNGVWIIRILVGRIFYF